MIKAEAVMFVDSVWKKQEMKNDSLLGSSLNPLAELSSGLTESMTEF